MSVSRVHVVLEAQGSRRGSQDPRSWLPSSILPIGADAEAGDASEIRKDHRDTLMNGVTRISCKMGSMNRISCCQLLLMWERRGSLLEPETLAGIVESQSDY